MACSIEISEEYRDKYGLPKEPMTEAEFYAWLANGGLQALTNDNKLSFDGYKIVDNKFKKASSIIESIVKSVKDSIDKLKKEIKQAKKDGAKEAISAVDFWQKEARSFLTKNEIKLDKNSAIERAIGRIRNEKTYARFLLTVESQKDAAIHFEKIENIRDLLKQISKLKKSKDITGNQKKFINDTSFPSPVGVLDLDTYANLLQEFLGKRKRGESAIGNVEERLKSFVDNENNYINYKRSAVEIDAALNDLSLEMEFDELNGEGVFEGTDIKTWQDYKLFFERVQSQLDISEQDQKIIAKVGKSSKVKEVETNIKTMLGIYGEQFKEAFDLASTKTMVKDFSLLKNADLSILSFKELVLLSNIIDGILYDGDFMAYDSFRSKFAQLERKKNLENVIKDATGKIRRLLDVAFRSKDPIPVILKKAAFGRVSEAYLETFFLGKFNAMISNIELAHNDALKEFQKLMDSLGSKMFESSVAIETFAFINQVDEGLTPEQEQEQFKNDSVVYAKSAQEKYNSNAGSANPTRAIEIQLKKSKYALDALARFGVIENLVFTKKGVTFDFVKDATREGIQGKLDAKEQAFYDFVIKSFSDIRQDFAEGMEVGLGIPFRGVKNYFPRFSDQFLVEEEKVADIKNLLTGFTGVSRTQDRAKARSRASGNYSVGLREHFSKGLWESMIVAYGQQQINDVVNSIYSDKFGVKSLVKGDTLGAETASEIIKAISSQVKKDLTYGNVSTNDENLISKEIARLFTSQFYGYILKTMPAFIKQYLPAYGANYFINPVSSRYAREILKDKDLLNKIMSQTTVVSRNFKNLAIQEAKYFPAEYLQGAEKKVVSGARSFPSLGDILKPIINLAREKMGKEVRTESMLDYGDVKASNMNIAVGVISMLRKENKNITKAEIKEKLNKIFDEEASAKTEDFVKEALLASAEGYQQALNAPSRSSQQSKTLGDRGLAQAFYMFGSFQLNTHADFLKHLNRLKYYKQLTPQERMDNAEMALAYVAQQALFRYGASVLVQFTLSALAKGLDDDEQDKIYAGEKVLIQGAAGLAGDVFLGSYGIFASALSSLAAELWWNTKKEEYLKEIKENNPEFNPKGTVLDPKKRLGMNLSVGGALVSVGMFFYDQIEEFNKEADILYKAGLPWTSVVMYPLLKVSALMLGSGTLRDASNALDIMQDKEMKKMAIVIGKIQGKQLEDPKQMQEILDDLKNVKTDDVRKQLVFVEEDGKADLYFMPKAKIEKYKKDAINSLYGINMTPYLIKDTNQINPNKLKDLYNAIIKTYDFTSLIKSAKIDDAAKKDEAVKQINRKVGEYAKIAVGDTSTGIKKYSLK